MIKWILTAVLVLVLVLALIYVYIPKNINVANVAFTNATAEATTRFMNDPAKWKKFGAQNETEDTSHNFSYGNTTYHIAGRYLNGYQINVAHKERSYKSIVNLLPIGNDSVALEWRTVVTCSNNPVHRLQQYMMALQLKSNMKDVLTNMANALSNEQLLYGLKIERVSTNDTLLIAARHTINHYPTVQEIYTAIDKVNEYVSLKGGNAVNAPLLNITNLYNGQFQFMVAIPVDKELPSHPPFVYKRMVPGYFMSAEVTGGTFAIDHAFNTIQQYNADHKKIPVAIPFQALLVNRQTVTDTTQWKTRWYFPVVR